MVTSSKLEVKLFGAIAVSRGATTLGGRDFGGTKAKQLFELLVLARGEPVPKDRLADLIWGEALPVHVNATLETSGPTRSSIDERRSKIAQSYSGSL